MLDSTVFCPTISMSYDLDSTEPGHSSILPQKESIKPNLEGITKCIITLSKFHFSQMSNNLVAKSKATSLLKPFK